MKKIMFNDKYGLTQAVLEGRKTQTRRIVPVDIINAVDTLCLVSFSKETLTEKEKDYNCYETCDGDFIDVRDVAKYKRGEEIAVAQSYESMANEGGAILANMLQDETTFKKEYCGAGWKNKMFVKPELMPHRIRITNVRVERLQDISNEDCIAEGIREYLTYRVNRKKGTKIYDAPGFLQSFNNPYHAFAALIDKVSGKGTWESNPWVFVYEFELTK